MLSTTNRTLATALGLGVLVLAAAAIWLVVFSRTAPGSAAGPGAPPQPPAWATTPAPTPEASQPEANPDATPEASPEPTPELSTFSSPPASGRQEAVFLGGGSVAGLGASDAERRWSTLLAAREGWKERNLGQTGAGYLTGGAAAAAAQVDEAAAKNPDIVVVAPGSVDLQEMAQDPQAVRAAIGDTLTGLREALPDARIVVLAPSYDTTAELSALVTLDRWVRAAARAAVARTSPRTVEDRPQSAAAVPLQKA